MLTASADRRFAASSKEVRVRVEASKKRLMTVLPRRAGTFFIDLADTSLNDSAVSRIVVISSTDSSLIPKRSFRLNGISVALRVQDPAQGSCTEHHGLISLHNNHLFVFVIVLQHHFDYFVVGRLNIFADIVC